MAWWEPFLYIFGGMGLLMLTGMPVAFAFLLVNLIGILILQGGGRAFDQLALSMYASVSSFTLSPIPLFILMGEILWRSGLAHRTLEVLDMLLGRIVGRQAILAVLSGTVFSSLSGSTMANTAILGTMLLPDMERRGYKRQMSIGPILASGGLAMMIPPSALGVILASIAQLSVSQILIGAMLPGLIMATLYASYILIRCRLDPTLAPPPQSLEHVPLGHLIRAVLINLVPLGFIIFLVTGLIVLGVATPTESAALGCAGSFILAAAYRQLKWSVVGGAFVSAAKITGLTFAILVGATGFSQLLAFSGATLGLLNWITGLEVAPLVIIIVCMLAILFLGTFMEQVAIMLITLPILIPVVKALGFDPIWFGIIMLINLQMGLTTPPFGLLLFVIKGVAPKDVKMKEIYGACIPFLICDAIVIALVMAFPKLVTWYRVFVLQ